jgi:hypothetical protein
VCPPPSRFPSKEDFFPSATRAHTQVRPYKSPSQLPLICLVDSCDARSVGPSACVFIRRDGPALGEAAGITIHACFGRRLGNTRLVIRPQRTAQHRPRQQRR